MIDRVPDLLRRYALLPAIQASPVLLLDAAAFATTQDARNTGGSEFRLLRDRLAKRDRMLRASKALFR